MQKTLWIKASVVFGLTLALLVPLLMIQGLVNERTYRQNEVIADIAASSAGQQRVFGPVLVVPYLEQWQETVETLLNGQSNKRQENRTEHIKLYLLPEQLDITGKLTAETKQRGLFNVRSYVLDSQFKGVFNIPQEFGKPQARHNGTLAVGKPYLAVTVADMRGVLDAPGLEWNGVHHSFEQGSGLNFGTTPGMHVSLEDLGNVEGKVTIPVNFTLKLRGLEDLEWVPAGRQTHVALSSSWPHPGFHGRFLPDPATQQVGADGFSANWSVNSLASNVSENLNQCKEMACFDSFGVRLIDPVNIYSMSDRATKYGFLFVCLTFAAIFLYEILQNLVIHPAQYTLVGLALAMFFLLLLSLSEHIGFTMAYLSAALACVGLLVFYLSAVMKSIRRATGAGFMLAGLYAALFGLLQSEDNALMLGSLLLFVLLTLAMTATRHLDWYGLGQANK